MPRCAARSGAASSGRCIATIGERSTHVGTATGFDPDAFTAWYLRQPGLSSQAFGAFYGASQSRRCPSCLPLLQLKVDALGSAMAQ